jgi:hypothetical protein
MIEVAIFGSLALLALGLLIQLALRQNYQQEIEQNAFRRALRVAHLENRMISGSLGFNSIEEESQAINYNYFRNRIMPSPSDGYGVGPRAMTQGSGTVTWGEFLTYLDDSRDSQPRIIVNLDDPGVPAEFRSEDFRKSQPLIQSIDKDAQASGRIDQWNTGSSRSSTATEDTTLTLNTKNNAKVQSRVNTTVNSNW